MIQEKKKVAFWSVIAAVFITGFKLIIGLLTGSLGILSEALHSGLDMVAAMITYFSVRVSDKPADRDHNYGHGKVENLSALIETILLLVTCLWIISEAVHRLTSGETKIEVTAWSYIVVICSIVIDFTRSRALYRVAKKHNSQALEADALHFSTDIWSSTVVLFGLICYQFLGWYRADSIAALFVAIIVGTTKIVQETLKEFPEVLKYHGLKARTAGADTFIKFNVHFDPDLSLREVHEVCDKIEMEIKKRVIRSEVYIHAEPEEVSHLENEVNDDIV